MWAGGTPTAWTTAAPSRGVNVNLATGIAQDGEGGTDTLIGIESVNGSSFDDLLTGSNAFLENFLGGAGNDTIYGAGGIDRAEYNNATSGVSISLGGFAGFSNSTGTVSGDASVGFDTLLDVEQFTGSNFADTFSVGSFLSGSSPAGSSATSTRSRAAAATTSSPAMAARASSTRAPPARWTSL